MVTLALINPNLLRFSVTLMTLIKYLSVNYKFLLIRCLINRTQNLMTIDGQRSITNKGIAYLRELDVKPSPTKLDIKIERKVLH